jgi:hypothetical protein
MPAGISISKKEEKWNFKSTGMKKNVFFAYRVNIGLPEMGMKFRSLNLYLEALQILSPL